MRDLLDGGSNSRWQAALREAAVNATTSDNRGVWLARLAAVGTLFFVGLLVALPGGLGPAVPGLSDAAAVIEQTRRLASGSLNADGAFPLAYPFWLLVVSKLTNDLAIAARLLSGAAAVVCLFLVYQLCHGLSDADRADEQSAFALLTLALSPSFFLAAAVGSTELPHLALLLGGLLLIQRAIGSSHSIHQMVLAGLLVGLSALMSPVSWLVPVAVLIWLWRSRPFDLEESSSTLRHSLVFLAAFTLGASPQLLVNSARGGQWTFWAGLDLPALGSRLTSDPAGLLTAVGQSMLHYAFYDDIERLAVVSGAWDAGSPGSFLSAMIALAPTLLKLLGVLGLITLCWLERFENGVERARMPALLVVLFVVGGSLGLVDARSVMPVLGLLVVFCFAALPYLLPGAPGGLVSLGLVALMVLHQVGAGYPARLAAAYRASDQVAEALRSAGATPDSVMSASWAFYDTRSPWKERYLHIPAYVDSVDGLVREMRRQGVTFLVFDRHVGAAQWPRLAPLLEVERPVEPELTPVGPALKTDESPPNTVAIYKLE